MAKSKRQESRIIVIDNLDELNIDPNKFYMFDGNLVPCDNCTKCKEYKRSKCKFNKLK